MALLPTLTSLKFFNKTGNAYNLYLDTEKGYYVGQINLPAVSIHLFECETIYILQEVEDGGGNPSLVHPFTTNQTTRPNITAKIKSTDQEFRLFDIDGSDANQANLTFLPQKDVVLDYDAGATVNPVTDRLVTTNTRSLAARFDIAFSSDTEENYTDKLIISMGTEIIAEIEIYCEAIGEDDRLTNHLFNFGEAIGAKDEFIFRDSDINEDLPNYRLLNEKRREYLLDLKNIQKYSSSYKGIYHVLFFFGFYDLKLKELWFNNIDRRFFYQDADLAERIFNETGDINVNRHLEKTSFFGLFYDINKVTSLSDANGLPILEDNFQYSDREIVVKLFGLKKWIRDRNIGGISRILDIIGEITQFSRLQIRYWDDRAHVFHYEQVQEAKFKADKTEIFIEDLRPLLNDFSECALAPDDDLSTITPDVMNKCFIGYFAGTFQTTPAYFDAPDIPIGAVLKLYNQSFGMTWLDASISWDDIAKLGLDMTWDNNGYLNFYKVEWIVKRRVGADDPRQWTITVAGKPDEVGEPSIFIPYQGEYDVTLVLHAYNGSSVRLTKERYITVLPKAADFFAFYKIFEPELQVWETCRLSWDKIMSDWKSPIYDSEEFQPLKLEIRDQSLKMSNYLANLGSSDRPRQYDNATWEDMKDLSWQDAYYLTWNDLEYNCEQAARFVVDRIASGGKLQIGKDVIQIPSDYNFADFSRLATLLNGLPDDSYTSVNLFTYAERTIGTYRYMEAVAKQVNRAANVIVAGSPGFEIKAPKIIENWNGLDFTNFGEDTWDMTSIVWDAAGVVGKVATVEEPFNWNNIRVYKNRFDSVVGAPVFLNFDTSQMAGKTTATWTILDEENNVVYTTQIPYFVYRFTKNGLYTVICDILDNKGNISSITKQNFIRVLKPHQFRTLIKLNKSQVPGGSLKAAGSFDDSFDNSFN